MPILNDIMDHPVLGRERKRGMKIGLEKGREEGKRELVLNLISQRFGPLPASARKRLATIPSAKIERIGLKLLRAESLDELLA